MATSPIFCSWCSPFCSEKCTLCVVRTTSKGKQQIRWAMLAMPRAPRRGPAGSGLAGMRPGSSWSGKARPGVRSAGPGEFGAFRVSDATVGSRPRPRDAARGSRAATVRSRPDQGRSRPADRSRPDHGGPWSRSGHGPWSRRTVVTVWSRSMVTEDRGHGLVTVHGHGGSWSRPGHGPWSRSGHGPWSRSASDAGAGARSGGTTWGAAAPRRRTAPGTKAGRSDGHRVPTGASLTRTRAIGSASDAGRGPTPRPGPERAPVRRRGRLCGPRRARVACPSLAHRAHQDPRGRSGRAR
jgi:hypothetical protein